MDIQPEQVAGLAGAQLIDVREDYEWDEGRIPDSRHVPLMQVVALADSIDQELPVVFICRVGGRSTMAANRFRGAGYEAYSLAGGVLEWQARGLPFDGVVAEH
jgi:rhodanese-related sulfurtransferase